MIYECTECGKALPPGATKCPNCGDTFDEAVPADAELPTGRFKPRAGFGDAASAPLPVSAPHPPPSYPGPQAPPQVVSAPLRKTTGNPAVSIIGIIVLLGIMAIIAGSQGRHSPAAPASVGATAANTAGTTLETGNAAASPDTSTPETSAPETSTPDTSATDNSASDVSASDTPPPDVDAPQLRVGSENFTKEDGYDTVVGEVTNISGSALTSVQAVTTFYDGSGNVVKTEDALIDFNPIEPGQTSPYKTMGEDNPLIQTEKTVFQLMDGPELATTKSSPPPTSGSDTTAGASDAGSSHSSGRDPVSETASAGSGLTDEPLPRHMLEDKIITDSDLDGKSLSALSISYNTIYAVHGYVFKRNSLQNVFSSKSWYHPDPSFSEAQLTPTEQANLKTIRAFERARFHY